MKAGLLFKYQYQTRCIFLSLMSEGCLDCHMVVLAASTLFRYVIV